MKEEHLNTTEPGRGRLNFESTISTASNQIALAPGDLIKSWSTSNRNYFHYKTKEPVYPLISYLSANYSVKKDTVNGIHVEQYYHSTHDLNIEAINTYTKEALEYCVNNFGEYPYKDLRVAEIPNHWGFGGFAQPGLIAMVENRLYLNDIRNPEGFDIIAKRTIHEVAHQWWGHILNPKYLEGGTMLVEGFAKYSEAIIMEKLFGKGAIWQLSQTANQTYFSGRASETETEPPLILVNDQSYLSYGKNYTAMLALRDLVGEKTLNEVLKKLTERHRTEVELTATSIEFIEELYKVCPEEYHGLIDDWFKKVVIYDLKIDDVTYEKLENGKFEIAISLNNKRHRTVENGDMEEIRGHGIILGIKE